MLLSRIGFWLGLFLALFYQEPNRPTNGTNESAEQCKAKMISIVTERRGSEADTKNRNY